MQTVFVIGNGFDVNLGLKTRYAEFYEYYLDIPTDNKNIRALKEHLRENKSDFWSDLEIALGKYTTRFSSFEQIEEVYDDINDEMKKYILNIENMPLSHDIDVNLFKKTISSPESFLSPAETNRIRALYNSISLTDHLIDIVNFNYTTTIDKIIGYNKKRQEIAPATYHSSFKTYINSILHVHGMINDPILGVDNVSVTDYTDPTAPETPDTPDIPDTPDEPGYTETGDFGMISLVVATISAVAIKRKSKR